MLNRQQLLAQMESMLDSIFVDNTISYSEVVRGWNELVADPTFAYKAHAITVPWPVPSWSDAIDTAIPVSSYKEPHHVLAVDGSQIYPDRHNSISCFLINIGAVNFHYYYPGIKPVTLVSQPSIFTSDQTDDMPLSTDFINCRRQELELQAGLIYARQLVEEYQKDPHLLLFDGSFIFWHLESKDTELLELFLPRYLAQLHHLYEHRIITASYISLPKSKELVNLVRLQLANFDIHDQKAQELTAPFVDASIAQLFLEPGQRSIVFKNNAAICARYLDHVRPYFFYIHVGQEIGRVEIPAYVAGNPSAVDMVARIIFDQCQKGRGYPIALAEAHEQAVVKGVDRDFFIEMIYRFGMKRKQSIMQSVKLQRKRNIGI